MLIMIEISFFNQPNILTGSHCTFDIIVCLLDSDLKRNTLHMKSKAGRLPLHMAIAKKMPPKVVRHFLGTNPRNEFCREIPQGSIELNYKEHDVPSISEKPIHVPFKGMLPLHLACWNDSSAKTIELLLD